MNDPSTSKLPPASLPSGARPDEEVCARALKPVRALRQLLEEERGALALAEPRALIALAERKTRLLGALEALQPALGEALQRMPEEDEVRREIVECLVACRTSNAENGVVTATASNHRSLDARSAARNSRARRPDALRRQRRAADAARAPAARQRLSRSRRRPARARHRPRYGKSDSSIRQRR